MQNEIIINAEPGETRAALLERSSFVELHIERECSKSVVGSVVKGRVSRVLPGMQAAFVDIGLDKAAFLYVGDYFASQFAAGENGEAEVAAATPWLNRGRGSHRSPPKIETVLSEEQEIVVQIAKAPIGTKGARITSHISIPGRHLVLTPWARRVGVSRRIDADRERRRLREIVERLRPKDLGFIIRTAGDGLREADLEADMRYLTSIWEKIQTGYRETPAPTVLHAEPGLALRVIRDFATTSTKRIVVDSRGVYESIKDFVDRFVADPKPKLEHYTGRVPIFDGFDLEAQIHANLERKVWLKSGASLIIDQSEALTAIDVNTGRYVGKRDLEETVFRTNLEAIKEIVYQLRFRNIGGLIIIDLIDMESAENREKTYRALQDALRLDKARTNILKISELGLVEMTRKRTRANLVQTLCEPCSSCEGRGYVLSRESVAFKVLRELRTDLPRFCGRLIAITVSPQVAEQLLTTGKKSLAELSEDLGREIEVRARPGLHQEQFEITALDSGAPVDLPLSWLEQRKPESKPSDTPQEEERKDEVPGKAAQPSGGGARDATPEAKEAPAAPSAPEIQAEGAAQPEAAEIGRSDSADAERVGGAGVGPGEEPSPEAAAIGQGEAGDVNAPTPKVENSAVTCEPAQTTDAETHTDSPGEADGTTGGTPRSPTPEKSSTDTVARARSSLDSDAEARAAEPERSELAPTDDGRHAGVPAANPPQPQTLAQRLLANATTLEDPLPKGRRRKGGRRRSAPTPEAADDSAARRGPTEGRADGRAPKKRRRSPATAPQPLDAATESRILPASRRHEES